MGYSPLLFFLTYFIFLPSPDRFEKALAISGIVSVFTLSILFPVTFLSYPYYNCKDGKHVVYAKWNYEEAWWECSKCDYQREFNDVEYKTIRFPMPIKH
jgi:hypothetical protein